MAPTRRKKTNLRLQLSGEEFPSEDYISDTQDSLASTGAIAVISKRLLCPRHIEDFTSASHGRLMAHQSEYRAHGQHPQYRLQHVPSTGSRSKHDRCNGIPRKSSMSLLVTVMLVMLLALANLSSAQHRCPRPCRCRSRGFVDCGFRNLNQVPRGIPRHVQRL
ncbi:hypothetical protein RRG08_052719 [Elysia crispata]|uniref:LRRNT domain-containing protein n=1 Tax=Elysia crispata TaxID=231223 RepID=A0AAE1B4M5_9GAST|nr:hypothetical protein RRG08_052719 [Elysia crispata]